MWNSMAYHTTSWVGLIPKEKEKKNGFTILAHKYIKAKNIENVNFVIQHGSLYYESFAHLILHRIHLWWKYDVIKI